MSERKADEYPWAEKKHQRYASPQTANFVGIVITLGIRVNHPQHSAVPDPRGLR